MITTEKNNFNNSQSSSIKNNQISINQIIIKIFKTIVENENKIEASRQALNDQIEFDPILIFKIIDKNNKEKITPEVLKAFLNNNSIFCDLETIKLLISFYDMNNDGYLNFEEFKNIVISDKNPGLKQVSYINKKLDKIEDLIISENIFHIIFRLFVNEILFANEIIKLLKNLTSNYNYNSWNLFLSIKNEDKDAITEDKLNEFININNINKINKPNLNSIFRRIDILKDGLIDFNEFKIFFNYKNYSKIYSLENLEYFKKENFNEKLTESFKSTGMYSSQNSFFKKTMNIDEKSISKSRMNTSRETILNNPTILPYSTINNFIKNSTIYEEELLINFFSLILKSEIELEQIKISLAKEFSFNLVSLYNLFLKNEDFENINKYTSNYQVEHLTKNGLKLGINLFESYPTENELNLITDRFLRKWKNGYFINYSNFCNIFLPNDQIYRRILKNRIINLLNCDKNNIFFNSEIKNYLKSLFNNIITNESNIEFMRIKLKKIDKFRTQTLFNKILNSNNYNDYITFNDLSNYLVKFNFSKDDVIFIFNRLDREGNNMITLNNVNN